jgi:uncharacterized integral membrane protein
MIKFINLVLLIIFIGLVLLFTAQNPEIVSVKFYKFQSIPLPISVIVFSSVIIGILIGLIYHFYAAYKIKKELKNEKEKL